ncbi:GNAT family N-acetyltransferase [Paenibacillus sp. ACRRY]|uniref:GNAT family N-acetyltransferase n=1 Tax=Paenibacillus sp. ACRRY TaxID=2918208 RepID=UPI001EF68340|nr:GNAT family N-acetyltransferase [Paenibacillus sp. ACRRY]MCG7381164.1 GNAT family N-acetyltransferase [Paenibacillus sp. ACRRY]
MNMQIELVPRERKQVIRHLMQFYLYDFTKYLNIDVDSDGIFPEYPGLEAFWEEEGLKFAFLITCDGAPAGFALVERFEPGSKDNDYYLTEFFVMQKYRRSGIGTQAAHELFHRFPGRWKVTQVRNNVIAQAFWRKVIGAYTGGRFREKFHPELGNPSQFFVT